MTESTATVPAAPEAERESQGVAVDYGYSKDYWDIVFEQLARRKLFKVGMAVLAVLYSIAVFAPMIANDRPYRLAAIDHKAYSDALRRPRLAARSAGELIAKRIADAEADVDEGLFGEADGLTQRLGVMRDLLPDEAEAPLDAFEERFLAALSAYEAGDLEAAAAAAKEAQDLGTDLRKELEAAPPGAEAESEGIRLEPTVSHPLFEAIPPRDVFLMVLNILLVTWPVWNRLLNRFVLHGDRETIRRWRKKKTFGVLLLCLLAAVLWSVFDVGEQATFEEGPYKRGLTSGEIVAVGDPVFPPLPYGYAEQHSEESFRPPSWAATADRDERGVPLHLVGTEGVEARYVPVEVRYAEPERNDWDRHIAGTDESGRDFLVRMVWGARVSLSVGILSALLLTLIGVVIGSLAGFFGGWVDIAIMRLIEIIQSIPAFFLILATLAFIPPDALDPIYAIVIVIALIRWTGVARLVRGEFLKLREQEFVVAAQALGFSSRRTMFRHVLPNAMSPVLVSAAFAVAAGILTESAVSFLGFGVQAPGASWGSLVNESKDPTHWWVQVFPGFLIFVTVTCYNLVGDAIRDALDPKLKV